MTQGIAASPTHFLRRGDSHRLAPEAPALEEPQHVAPDVIVPEAFREPAHVPREDVALHRVHRARRGGGLHEDTAQGPTLEPADLPPRRADDPREVVERHRRPRELASRPTRDEEPAEGGTIPLRHGGLERAQRAAEALEKRRPAIGQDLLAEVPLDGRGVLKVRQVSGHGRIERGRNVAVKRAEPSAWRRAATFEREIARRDAATPAGVEVDRDGTGGVPVDDEVPRAPRARQRLLFRFLAAGRRRRADRTGAVRTEVRVAGPISFATSIRRIIPGIGRHCG